MNILLWLLPGAVATSIGLTWALRHYALAHHVIDIPNERSSHSSLIPRGGGMAIALTFLGVLAILWARDVVPWRPALALIGSGAFVALIGFVDDHYHVLRRWRFMAHFVAAGWALFCLHGMPSFSVVGIGVLPAWLVNAFAILYAVWMVNLYNFMDGIDGIASIEAITVCLGGTLLYLVVAAGGDQWVAPVVMTAAVAGFLYWNFPPARIFMGDAGSGFLGMMLAVFSIQAAWVVPNLFWSWIIMLAVFVVDASVTLIRRMLAGGGKYLHAHRSHAYQHAARKYGTHKTVSLTIGAINVVWLWPLALAVGLGYLNAAWGLLIAYLPLVGLAIGFRAGADER